MLFNNQISMPFLFQSQGLGFYNCFCVLSSGFCLVLELAFVIACFLFVWSFRLFGSWLVPLRHYSSSKFPSFYSPPPPATLPVELGQMTQLEVLDVSGNNLQLPLPRDVSRLPAMAQRSSSRTPAATPVKPQNSEDAPNVAPQRLFATPHTPGKVSLKVQDWIEIWLMWCNNSNYTCVHCAYKGTNRKGGISFNQGAH